MPSNSYRSVRAPEFLDALAAHAAQELAHAGVDPATAVELGQRIATRIAQLYGGTWLRVPTGTWNGGGLCFDLSRRDLAIYRAFDGRNRDQVLRDFDISESYLYRIIKRVRELSRSAPGLVARRGLASNAAPDPKPAELTPSRRAV